MRSAVVRGAIGTLSISAVAFVGYLAKEGYTDSAVIPTKGDRPTVGFGSTFKEDGSPVKMGDTTTPVQAAKRTLAHLLKDDARLKQCVTAPVHQAEYEALLDHTYQYGVAATCESGMVAAINRSEYEQACRRHLEWRKIGGKGVQPHQGVIGPDKKYDCRQLVDGKPNRVCWGVWVRAQARFDKCMSANPGTPSLGVTG